MGRYEKFRNIKKTQGLKQTKLCNIKVITILAALSEDAERNRYTNWDVIGGWKRRGD